MKHFASVATPACHSNFARPRVASFSSMPPSMLRLIAGCAAALVCGSATAQVTITSVVTSGEPAPGLPAGTTFSAPLIINTFDGDPFGFAIADNGMVAFRAPVAGETIETNNDFSLWTAVPGQAPSLLLRESDPAPGLPAGVRIDQLSFTSMNPVGRVIVAASVAGPGVDFTNFVGFWTIDNGVADVPLRTGDTAPGAGDAVFQTFDRIPTQNTAGGLALPAGLTGSGIDPSNRQGVWAGMAPTALDAAFRASDSLPGEDASLATFNPPLGLGAPVIDNTGRVVALRALTGGSVMPSDNRAIIAASPAETVSVIARTGRTAPGGGQFVELDPPALTPTGVIAFTARVNESGAGLGVGDPLAAVFAGPAGSPIRRFVAGDAVPGGGARVFTGFEAVSVALDGRLAVRARASEAGGPDIATLWTDAGGSSAVIATAGDEVPGGPAGATFGGFGRPIITASGRVVFSATDAGTNARGVYLYSPTNSSLTALIREGQIVDTDNRPGIEDLRTVLTLVFDDRGPEVSVNASGQTAVRVGYAEGGASILVASLGDCAGDFDNNGTANVFDIIAFLGAWSAGNDFNMDGATNIFDIIDFLGIWQQGCP